MKQSQDNSQPAPKAGPPSSLASELLRICSIPDEQQRKAEVTRLLGSGVLEAHALMRDLPEYAIITMNPEGVIESWNAGAAQSFGYEEAEVTGTHFRFLFVPEDQAGGIPETELATAEKNGRAPDERWHLRKDGTRFYVSGTTTAVYDGNGGVSQFIKIGRDVTQQKLAEDSLRNSEQFKRTMIEQALDCIISIDSSGRILEFNPASERTFGFKREDVMGRQLADLIIPPSMREAHYRGMERYLRTNEPHVIGKRIEVPAQRADGTEFPCELNIVRHPGNPPTFTAFMRDVTDRSLADAIMRRSQEQLQVQVVERTEALEKVAQELTESQRLLGFITDISPILLMVIDVIDRQIIYANRELENMLGYNVDTFRNADPAFIASRIHPSDSGRVLAEIAKITATGENVVHELECRVLDAKGNWRWIFSRVVLFRRDDNGNIREVLCATLDVSERRRVEDERRLLQSIGTAVTQSRNLDAALNVVLKELGEASGWSYGELWLPESDENVLVRRAYWASDEQNLEIFREASRGFRPRLGEGLPGEVWQSGTTIWADDVTTRENFVRRDAAVKAGLRAAVGVPILSENRTVVGVLTFYLNSRRDEKKHPVELIAAVAGQLGLLIDRQVAEEQVRRMNVELESRIAERTADLQAALKELESFSYSVSHDLRAPLRAINAYSRIVAEDFTDQVPEEAKRMLGLVADNARRMGHLIEDLLAFSRVGRQELIKQPYAMEEIARSALQDLEMEMEGRDITFNFGELPAADIDPALMKQVYMNLLSNAIKYTGKTDSPVIEISSGVHNGTTAYYVRDNGAGFNNKYTHKLFGVFQRLHTESEFPGTGVGLAIVHRIITRHGGKVWAEGEKDQGATFYFTVKQDT